MFNHFLKSHSRATVAIFLLLVFAPLIVKAPLLSGWLNANPMLLFSGLVQGLAPGPAGGYPPFPTIDPSIAFTSQAFGHRAAVDVLHGHMPWWNFYEGVGTPLAGEMQSAALFPLNWLLYFNDGQLYLQLILQIIAGLSTYALLRKLAIARFAALAAALVFEFNGTFAWFSASNMNPIPFLPLALFGIECARTRVEQGRRGGSVWITIGMAASLFAGFPEVAYLNGLLMLAWTLVRVWSLEKSLRWRFLVRVFSGGLAALAIAAPILIAFLDYLPLSYLGMHDGETMASAHLSPSYLLALAIPYAFGAISEHPLYAGFWGNVGGYAGCIFFVLALLGLFGTTQRKLRLMLGIWVLVALAITYGIPGERFVVHAIPGLKFTAFYRYLPPSWEISLCILMGWGLSDLQHATDTNALRTMTFLLMVFVAVGALLSHREVPLGYGRTAYAAWILGVCSIVALLALSIVPMQADSRARLLAILVVCEAVLFFALPTMSYPSQGQIELGGIKFLQSNLGQQRFVTFGPIAPNYGAYFGIASVYHDDLPIPRLWTDFIATRLDDNTSPVLFLPQVRTNAEGSSAADNLSRNINHFRSIGTRYLVTSASTALPEVLGAIVHQDQDISKPLAEVYKDDVMRIFDLGVPRPYFSAEGCKLNVDNRNVLNSDCPHPSPLTRLELFMPGWKATINGRSADVAQSDEIFQKIQLPQGSAHIKFGFEPPFMKWGYLIFALGWLLLLLTTEPSVVLRRVLRLPDEAARLT